MHKSIVLRDLNGVHLAVWYPLQQQSWNWHLLFVLTYFWFSVPIEITNYEDDDVTLLILYDEDFPTRDLLSDDHKHKHVELVKNILPDRVKILTNETIYVHVNFYIPDYVPMFYRSKVTVSVKKLFTNISDIRT